MSNKFEKYFTYYRIRLSIHHRDLIFVVWFSIYHLSWYLSFDSICKLIIHGHVNIWFLHYIAAVRLSGKDISLKTRSKSLQTWSSHVCTSGYIIINFEILFSFKIFSRYWLMSLFKLILNKFRHRYLIQLLQNLLSYE